jgi:hypothetical protein
MSSITKWCLFFQAFEIAEVDQKIEMAKELGSNLLKCVCDQHANHAIQKCIECVPPQHIQFVYRSLRGKVKMLSCHPFGCHVIQVVRLGHCTFGCFLSFDVCLYLFIAYPFHPCDFPRKRWSSARIRK